MSRLWKQFSPMYNGILTRKVNRALRENFPRYTFSGIYIEINSSGDPDFPSASAKTDLSSLKYGLEHSIYISRESIEISSKEELAFSLGHENAHISHTDTYNLFHIGYCLDRTGSLPRSPSRMNLLFQIVWALYLEKSYMDNTKSKFNVLFLSAMYLRRKFEILADERSAQTSLAICDGGLKFFSRFISEKSKLSLKDAILSSHPSCGARVMNLHALRTDMTGEKCHAVSRRLAGKDY